jgi:hypothetical protein
MPVSARFTPESVQLFPGASTTASLRLHNNGGETATVTLGATGDLAEHLRLDSTTATLEPNQTVDVGVEVQTTPTVLAARYAPGVEVTGDGDPVIASLDADVMASRARTVELRPLHSRSSTVGRHAVRVVNTGNVPVVLELSADDPGDLVRVDVQSTLSVPPGATAEAAVRVEPNSTFWSGQPVDHEFVVRIRDTDAATAPASTVEPAEEELVGTFEQRPRVPGWLGPAAAGATAALVIGALTWFAWIRPWVLDRADQAAADAIEADRAALQERIDELEQAAAEAEELPLGEPFDLRLDVAPAGGNTAEASESVAAGRVLSVTDVVFQNPGGAVGTVTLLRDDDVLLQSELANFRDFDLHLVAPYVFEGGSEVTLRVECRTPGPDGSECVVGASILGFLDEAR